MKVVTFLTCTVFLVSAVLSDNSLLLLSFDGFRHDFLQKTDTPNFRHIIENGVKAPFVYNAFTTKTLVNHFTIATGHTARVHGIVNNQMFDMQLGKKLSPNNESFWTWGVQGDSPVVVPIWKVNEEIPGKYSGSSMWAGSDHVNQPTYNIPYNHSIPWVERIEEILSWMTNTEKPASFVSLYFDEPDMTEHMYGPESEEVLRMIEKVDNTTGYIVHRLKELNLWETTDLIITSDHGFTEVTSDRIINISAVCDPSLYNFYGESPVMHVLPNEGTEDFVYKAFKVASLDQNFTAYLKSELPREWRYANRDRTLPIVLVADEGYVFDDFHKTMEWLDKQRNETMKRGNVYGMHGYDSRLPSMHPFFVAHGPSFKVNYTGQPFHSVDIYPLMCNLLGIKAPPNEGRFERVEEYLKDPYGIQKYGFTIMAVIGTLVLFVFLLSVGLLLWISCSSRRSPVQIVIEAPSRSPKKGSLLGSESMPEIEGLLTVKDREDV